MKRIRNHKRICLLMAIVVMISGICLEKIPVNSCFSCQKANIIATSDSSLNKLLVYKVESLIQKEVLASIQSTRREAKRTSVREENKMTKFCVLQEKRLSQNFHSYAREVEDNLFDGAMCSLSILNYIHKQDGEKA